jgi:hypothetical protein
LAKIKISSTDLIWIFREKLSLFDDGASTISIAIVPSDDGWTVVAPPRARKSFPKCIRRIEQLQNQLREVYALAKD